MAACDTLNSRISKEFRSHSSVVVKTEMTADSSANNDGKNGFVSS